MHIYNKKFSLWTSWNSYETFRLLSVTFIKVEQYHVVLLEVILLKGLFQFIYNKGYRGRLGE